MFEDLSKAISDLKKANSVIIFSPSIDTVDKAISIVTLARICKKKKKSVQVLCPKTLKASIGKIFKNEEVDIVTAPTTKDYIVSVDYSVGNIDKVICKRDERAKKLNFIITPKDEEFNFDNVELISGGSSFDLVFSFGLENLNSVNEEYQKIFENAKVISITKKETDIGKYKFLLNDYKSYSEFIYEFAKAFSESLSEEDLTLLLQGVISKYKLLENGNDDGWLIANKFIKYGADFNQALRDLYYSKDYENFELQRKVLENIRVDRKNKVAWSKVALMMDVDSSNLDIKGRILFNVCEEFDIAFVLYHLDKENIKVVFESNNPQKYPALELAEAFSGHGTNSRVVFSNGSLSAEDFEEKLFTQIYSLFDIKVC